MHTAPKIAAAVGILLIGVGLCVGGIYVPALLIPGGVIIAGAIAMLTSVYTTKSTTTPDNSQTHLQTMPEIVTTVPSRPSIEANLTLFFLFREKSIKRPDLVKKPSAQLEITSI